MLRLAELAPSHCASRLVPTVGSAASETHLCLRSDRALETQYYTGHAAAAAADRPLAYGVVFLRLGGGLGCFSPAIDNYID